MKEFFKGLSINHAVFLSGFSNLLPPRSLWCIQKIINCKIFFLKRSIFKRNPSTIFCRNLWKIYSRNFRRNSRNISEESSGKKLCIFCSNSWKISKKNLKMTLWKKKILEVITEAIFGILSGKPRKNFRKISQKTVIR